MRKEGKRGEKIEGKRKEREEGEERMEKDPARGEGKMEEKISLWDETTMLGLPRWAQCSCCSLHWLSLPRDQTASPTSMWNLHCTLVLAMCWQKSGQYFLARWFLCHLLQQLWLLWVKGHKMSLAVFPQYRWDNNQFKGFTSCLVVEWRPLIGHTEGSSDNPRESNTL